MISSKGSVTGNTLDLGRYNSEICNIIVFEIIYVQGRIEVIPSHPVGSPR